MYMLLKTASTVDDQKLVLNQNEQRNWNIIIIYKRKLPSFWVYGLEHKDCRLD